MQSVSSDLHGKYKAVLVQNRIPAKESIFFLKWLRYYVDFYLKYRFPQKEKSSLSPFLGKLREKKQTSSQPDQAFRAINIYYEVVSRE